MPRKGKGGDQEDEASTSISSTDISPTHTQQPQGLEQRESRKLNEISKKLSLILTAIENLTDTIKENNTQVRQPQNESIQPALNEMTQVLTDLSSNISATREQNTETLNRTRTVQAEDDASKFRTLWESKWEFKLKKRREAFWNMTKNSGQHQTYEKWIEADTIIVPRYLQRKKFVNEQEEQMTIRASAAKNDYKAEIELKKLRAEQSKQRFEEIDKEMTDFIKENSRGDTRDVLIARWTNETTRNENISKKRWKRNEKWMIQYESDFQKEYRDQNPFFKTMIDTTPNTETTPREQDQTASKQRANQGPSYRPEYRRPRRRNVGQEQRNFNMPSRQSNFPQGQRNTYAQKLTNNENDFLELSDSDSTIT